MVDEKAEGAATCSTQAAPLSGQQQDGSTPSPQHSSPPVSPDTPLVPEACTPGDRHTAGCDLPHGDPVSTDVSATTSAAAAAAVRPGGKHRGAPRHAPFVCQVDSCGRNLSKEKEYYRRYRVCKSHASMPEVEVGGVAKRYCQQCSVFHPLGDFDGDKRSCRERLSWHNNKRRKRGQDEANEAAAAAAATAVPTSAPRVTRRTTAATAPKSAAASDSEDERPRRPPAKVAKRDGVLPVVPRAPRSSTARAGGAGPNLPACGSAKGPRSSYGAKQPWQQLGDAPATTARQPPGTWLERLDALRQGGWSADAIAGGGAAAAPNTAFDSAGGYGGFPGADASAGRALQAHLDALAAAGSSGLSVEASSRIAAARELSLRAAAAGLGVQQNTAMPQPDSRLTEYIAALLQQQQEQRPALPSWTASLGGGNGGLPDASILQAQLQMAVQRQAEEAEARDAAAEAAAQAAAAAMLQNDRMQDPRASTALINVAREHFEKERAAAALVDDRSSAFQPYKAPIKPKPSKPQPLAASQPEANSWRDKLLQRFQQPSQQA